MQYTVYAAEKADGAYTAIAEGLVEAAYTHSGLAAGSLRYYQVEASAVLDGRTLTGQRTSAVSAVTEKPGDDRRPPGENGSVKACAHEKTGAQQNRTGPRRRPVDRRQNWAGHRSRTGDPSGAGCRRILRKMRLHHLGSDYS